jgi:hypothetical protein
MSEVSPKIYFVAGATRGLGIFTKCRHFLNLRTDILVFIGLALVDDIATKDPSAVIYAGARDPTNGAALLIQVAAKYPGRVQVVKYVAGDKEGNDALAKQIAAEHGRLDTVIANAGAISISPCSVICSFQHTSSIAICATTAKKVHETPADKFTDEFSVRDFVLCSTTYAVTYCSPSGQRSRPYCPLSVNSRVAESEPASALRPNQFRKWKYGADSTTWCNGCLAVWSEQGGAELGHP